MFRDNTVFVIGAGASSEFGLPTGWQLAKKIKKRAKIITSAQYEVQAEDEYIDDIIKQNYRDRTVAYAALKIIEQGIRTAVSIDALIHRHSDIEEVANMGKLLIALEISKAERESNMHRSQIETHKNVETWKTADDTWIGSFARILFDGVTDYREIGKNISIICFNYDRCIEYYLIDAIASAFQVPISKAHEIVMGMNIIHPYGTLGNLPNSPAHPEAGALEFGVNIFTEVDWLLLAKKNIRTYTQRTHDTKTVRAIHDAMEECRVLVFLGFGFNSQNLDLLRVVAPIQEKTYLPVYSSGCGIRKQVSNTLKRRIGNLYPEYLRNLEGWRNSIQIEHGHTCSELLDIHNMNLSKFKPHHVDAGGNVRAMIDLSMSTEWLDNE